MKPNRHNQLLLTIIIILLIALLIKPIFAPTEAYSKKLKEYITVSTAPFERGDKNKVLEQTLNKYAKEGWQVHTVAAKQEFVVLEK